MPPAFLNSREDALLIWTLVILGYVFYKNPRGMASSLWNLGRAFFTPTLMLLFGSAVAYSAAIVFAAERIGVWHLTSVKETVYWFIASAVVLIARAVDATPGPDLFREIVRKAAALTIVVEFVTSFYVFPLVVEIPLVFLALALTMLSAVPSGFKGTDPRISIVVGRGLAALGLLLLATFGLRAILDPSGLFTVDTAERLLIVPALTLALTPYLFVVAWYFRREDSRLRQRFARDYLVGPSCSTTRRPRSGPSTGSPRRSRSGSGARPQPTFTPTRRRCAASWAWSPSASGNATSRAATPAARAAAST